jgi:hypothetical protein
MDGSGHDDADARGEPREATRKGAVIELGADKGEVRCMVANIGENGAEIWLEEHQRVPPRFVLHVPGNEMAYRAEVRWRAEGGRIGLAFHAAEPRPRKTGLSLVSAR